MVETLNSVSNDESSLFPHQDSVIHMLYQMGASVKMINSLAEDSSTEALDVIARNKDYLAQCLSYEAIQTSGADLSPYDYS